MNREVREAVTRGAAHILRGERVRIRHADAASGSEDDPGLQRSEVDPQASGRNRVDDFLRDDLLDRRALDVYERRLAGDGDCLSDRADFQVRVDAGDERA